VYEIFVKISTAISSTTLKMVDHMEEVHSTINTP
jgi:hypothetical protein